ncbi:MAG: hypothetical protein ACTSQF_13660 [Candidatus Heimdallarchaeaceae archaeon]
MVGKLWGDTEETAKLSKRNLEEHIERILLEKKTIHINDLFNESWHSYHLLTHYMQIFLIIKELEEEGKIIVDEHKNISLIKTKKEIIERYSTINYLA